MQIQHGRQFRSPTGEKETLHFMLREKYEKPIFLVKRNDSIVNTYYIQDHTTGFELYEINNKQTFTQPGMALDIGTLRYRFIKQ